MDKKIIFTIIAVIIIASAATILLPGGRQVDPNPKLPWLIDVDATGATSVFGLTLGQSTLAEAEQMLQQTPEISLFRATSGHIDVEAYFDRIYLSGLKANIVAKVSINQADGLAMFERGSRISQMGSGSKKVSLSEADKLKVAELSIDMITYLPGANLEPELVEKHFGKAVEVIKENEEITHWLYPDKGLDIAINTEGKEVFQYVLPADFNRVREPLNSAQ